MFKTLKQIIKKLMRNIKSNRGNSLAEFAVTTAMMATFIFGILTWLILGETPDTKTWICLILSLVIILIQLSEIKL